MTLFLLDKAFNEQLATLRIIQISGVGIALVIQMLIGLLAFSKMRHHPATGRELKLMFFVSLFSACSYGVVHIVQSVLALESDPNVQYAFYVASVFLCLFFMNLLLTLVMRLYLIFRGTIFEMRMKQIWLFIAIFIIFLLLGISNMIGWILFYNGHEDIGFVLDAVFASSSLVVYIFGSFLAVRFFVKNLEKMALLRVNSHRDVTASADAIALNNQQKHLLDLSAKYVLLFVIAISSSVFDFVLLVVVSWEMGGLFVSIDFCVNLFCLYLQFAFAVGHYEKCCFCLDSRCRDLVSKRTKESIHRNSLSTPSPQKETPLETAQ